jgi:Rhodanese-like domain
MQENLEILDKGPLSESELKRVHAIGRHIYGKSRGWRFPLGGNMKNNEGIFIFHYRNICLRSPESTPMLYKKDPGTFFRLSRKGGTMSKSSIPTAFIVLLMAICIIAPPALGDDGVPRIEPEQLKERLNEPDLHIIDVRALPDWDRSDTKIAGAVRADYHDISSWAKTLPKDALIVLYCS